jgi:hypothetical protein
LESHLNKDSVVFLRLFLPAGQEASRINLQKTCRTLHLAFQNMSYDEVRRNYDGPPGDRSTCILAGMVLKAIHGYDPAGSASHR